MAANALGQGAGIEEDENVELENRAIVAELEMTKSKYLTASFYLNAVGPIVNCPDVIGAVFDEGGARRRSTEMLIPRGDLIRLYVHSLKKLAETSGSQVYDVELLHDNIVVKTSYRGKYDVEFAIGFYFLNSLRVEIPNFMQTYEKFSCTGLGEICRSVGSEALALEKVKGKTVEKVIGSMLYEDVCLLLLQVYLALIVANQRFEYCHRDLHENNVIVYEVEPTSITYNVGSYIGNGEENITIVVPFIAVIIDYGFSRVKYNGRVLCNSGDEVGNRSYIDFYNFLESCMRHWKKEKKLGILLKMIPSMYGAKKEEGINFARTVIAQLRADCTKLTSETTYTPTTCKRRRRTSPIQSTLDYYEEYPLSKDREVDAEMVLDKAIAQMQEVNSLKPYLTYSKLYIFFYERHRSTNPVHKEHYDKCVDILGWGNRKSSAVGV